MATYTTKSGDMWDSIAYKQLGSMSYADRLINANLQHKDTYLFPSGVVLTLPEIEKPINSLLLPWKKRGWAHDRTERRTPGGSGSHVRRRGHHQGHTALPPVADLHGQRRGPIGQTRSTKQQGQST